MLAPERAWPKVVSREHCLTRRTSVALHGMDYLCRLASCLKLCESTDPFFNYLYKRVGELAVLK